MNQTYSSLPPTSLSMDDIKECIRKLNTLQKEIEVPKAIIVTVHVIKDQYVHKVYGDDGLYFIMALNTWNNIEKTEKSATLITHLSGIPVIFNDGKAALVMQQNRERFRFINVPFWAYKKSLSSIIYTDAC